MTKEKLYRFHCENLRQVAIGIERTALAARRAIATSDPTTLNALTHLYALLLGAWAECRLKKVLYEPSGFADDARNDIRSQDTQSACWSKAVELAFRKRFGIAKAPLNSSTLPFTAAARYEEVLDLLEKELRPVIELRNKFAHGQWAYLLTNDEEEVNSAHMAAFKKESLLTLQLKQDLLSDLAGIVNDLVVSTAFDRDFDYHYKAISYARSRLQSQSFEEYSNRLRTRAQTGRAKRKFL